MQNIYVCIKRAFRAIDYLLIAANTDGDNFNLINRKKKKEECNNIKKHGQE